MTHTTYEQMTNKISSYDTFSGSSVTGIDGPNYYIVYSYRTQILKIDKKNNTGIYNGTRYSNTTRKIQSILENDILPYLEHIKYKNGLPKGAIL